MKQRGLLIAVVCLLSMWVFLGFNISNASANFGPSQPPATDFGDTSTAAATDAWIEGSVHESNGVLVIQSNSSSSMLNPTDFGGKDGFIWRTMIEMTKNGKQMTILDISHLATAIIAKYLNNVDLWPKVKAELQTWGLSSEVIKSLQTKFENTSISSISLESMKKIIDANITIGTSSVKTGSASIVGGYDEKTHKFVTESGSYKDGALIDPQTGKEIPKFMVDNNYGSIYQRLFMGTLTGEYPVYISGDVERLAQVGKASDLITNYLDKNKLEYNDEKNNDGSITSKYFVCLNYAQEMQKMLEENDIDAYTVFFSGTSNAGHAAVAVKTGEVKYSNGKNYPTFAVIEPEVGTVMGQLGGIGTQASDTYSKLIPGSENATVVKDYILEKGFKQITYSKSNGIYTYTSTRDIEVRDDGRLYVDGIAVTDVYSANP